jgi:Fe2+ or Zn2+ uptake regulation protein
MPGNHPTGHNPNVDELTPAFTDPSVEERIYSLIVQSGEEWSAPAVADELNCSTDTARKYLTWFAELGIVHKHDGRPTTYKRNEDYFEWRYVTQLAEAHTLTELKENVIELREQLETYRERYGVESPDAIDLTDDVQNVDKDIERVWDDLTAWASIEDELRLHERARQRISGETESSTA